MKTLILFLISFLISSTTFAASFADKFLDGDSRYIKVGASMGAASYFDRDSVKVELYEPPIYIISMEILSVPIHPANGNTIYSRSIRFKYDYENRKIYTFDRDNNEIYIDPDVYYGEGSGYRIPAAEAAFAIAYNLKFYGNMDQNFYDSIDFGRGTIQDSL